MRSLKLVLGIAITTVGVGGVGASLAISGNVGQYFKADATVNFSTEKVTRRIWFVNKDNWWTTDTLYVHVWGGSLAADQWSGAASKIYDSYHYGLYYADIEAVGIGSDIYAQVKNANGSDASYYTTGVHLPALSSKSADVIALKSGYDGSGNRNAELMGTAGGTSGYVAVILEHTLSCDSSYAYGYNSYPQLDANFLTPSSGEITSYGAGTMVDDFDYDEYVDNGKSYNDLDRTNDYTNVTDKIAQLRDMYDTYGWKAS